MVNLGVTRAAEVADVDATGEAVDGMVFLRLCPVEARTVRLSLLCNFELHGAAGSG